MKKLIVLFIIFCLAFPIFVSAQKFPHIKIGVYDLGGVYYSGLSTVATWFASHADFIIGGGTGHNLPEYSNTTWVYYTKIIGLYSTPDDVYNDLRNFSDSNGYEFENIFVHMKQDYTARYSWSGMDKFDAFESAKGVFVDNGGVLTDKTTEGYSAATGDVAFTSNLYIGYGMPYAEMNFILSKNASGLIGSWQYWNGTGWKNLSQIADGTNNFTQNGKISFLPPSDWARSSISGSTNKYFLRYNVISASTLPVISKIYGDNWMAGSRCRGWNSSDLNIINSGELAFNPSPPANATAKFRYQARATGYWASNYVFANPAYVSNGKRVWGEYVAQERIKEINNEGSDGVYFDSLGGGLSNGISDPPTNQESYSDFFDYTSNSWNAESLEEYKFIVDKIHAVLPWAIVGGNTDKAVFAMAGDYGFRESATSPGFGGALAIMQLSGSGYTTYDNFLPANNPKGLIGIFQHIDTVDYRPNGAFWDRSNRGPITSLSSHYIAMNDKTYYHYFSRGGFFYIEADDILVFDSRETILTSNILVATSSAVKYIYGQDFSNFPSSGNGLKPIKIGDNIFISSFSKVNNQMLSTTDPIYYSVNSGARIRFVAQTNDRLSNYTEGNYPAVNNVYRWGKFFPAMFYDIGQPDSTGWNNGNRGIWTNGIWRRDFTKAIVLNLPAVWNSTREQFETYSSVINLGGSYRSLKADETLGPVISSIQLRTGEGAILIKSSGTGDTIPPAAPTGLTVN